MNEITSIEYQLTEPYVIKSITTILTTPSDSDHETLVEPVLSGICGSDLAYFRGKKSPEKLKKRLPLALLHEGIVRTVGSSDLSVIVPLRSCGVCMECSNGKPNLCPGASFMGSTGPGLSRAPFYYPTSLLLPVPPTINPRVAAITEPMTIAHSFARTVGTLINKRVMVIGNGSLAYITVIMLVTICHVPKDHLFVVGINEEKLRAFDNIATTINSATSDGQSQQASLTGLIDLGIEAAGGDAMMTTINTLITLVKPGGWIALFGLSDILIPINVVDIVNKGLKIQGVTRSIIEDYHAVLNLLEDSDLQQRMMRIIDPRVFEITNADDLTNALHFASAGRHRGKVLVSFSSL